MLKLDLEQISQAGDTFFSTKDMAYMIFMIIGIIGYFTVPSIANSIVQVSGVGALTTRVTQISAQATHQTIQGGQTVVHQSSQVLKSMMGLGNSKVNTEQMSGNNKGNYMNDKLSGKE